VAKSPQLGLRFKDLAVLSSLLDSGADLSQPRHVLYYSYFTDPGAAEQAAQGARDAGFATEVRDPLPDYPGQWAMVSEMASTVVSFHFVRDSDDLFQGLADQYAGEYDGWEASV
jgi:hypothetical protein